MSRVHTDVAAEELRKHLRWRLAMFWVPDEIVFVTDIPKTSVGKFVKKRRWSCFHALTSPSKSSTTD